MSKYTRINQLFNSNPLLENVEIYEFIEEIEESKNPLELFAILKRATEEYYAFIYCEAYDLLETNNKGQNEWDKAYGQILSLEKEIKDLF